MDTSTFTHENYVFNLDKRYKDKKVKRYTCNAKSTTDACPVVAWIAEDNTVTLQGGDNGQHDHPLPTKHHRAPAIAEIREQARLTDASPNEIVNNVLRSNRDAAEHISLETARRHVHRERRLIQPSLPDTFRELNTIFSNYQKINDIYRGCIQGADNSMGYIFGSNQMIDKLQEAQEIHIDGTFDAVPNKPRAEQLIIILMRRDCTGIPILFILTDRRTTDLYSAVWTWLIGRLPSLPTTLKAVISDFEVALASSIQIKLPWVQHRGCWFHFTKAVTQKWKRLTLPESGEDCEPLYLTWALPLLPSNYFEEGIEYINAVSRDLQNQNSNYTDFLRYLRRQWEPKADIVSVFGTSWRTNNIAEEFNRHLIEKLGGKHPALYKFLDRLINIICDSDIEYCRIMNGTTRQNHSRATQHTIDLYINNLQESLRNGRMILSDYLWAVVERTNIRRQLRQRGSIVP